MKRKAILLDVRSIQRYIYAANKLRTNIGASYIVENLFQEKLVDVLNKEFSGNKDLHSWNDAKAGVSEEYDCQIAYIGGGNAMVLFNPSIKDEELKRLIALFSQKVMIEAPGLHIGAAIGELDVSDEGYEESRNNLFKILKENQNNISPNVSLPYTGFTQVCGYDGEVATYNDAEDRLFSADEKHQYYSHEAAAKARVFSEANKTLAKMFSDELGDIYDFPTKLDELGQTEPNNYIAIVHIDGNNMGVKFSNCTTLNKHRSLSASIKKKTKNSFAKLLRKIIAEYDEYREHEALKTQEAKGKKLLPIRPLIIGGDDVTFVCPAKVAIAYSKRFINYMAEISSEEEIKDDEARSIDCCGGIAILNTKYPFFRGYMLSEKLCDTAKKKMRETWDQDIKGSGSSWVDFVFLHGEQAPTLEQILDKEYKAVMGNMHFGPYCVIKNTAGKQIDDDHLLDKLIECAKQFSQKGKYMQKNKVKGLRSVLQKDKGMIQSFMVQLNHLGQKLPSVEYGHVDKETGWGTLDEKKFTPYVDAIELMDYMEGAEKK